MHRKIFLSLLFCIAVFAVSCHEGESNIQENSEISQSITDEFPVDELTEPVESSEEQQKSENDGVSYLAEECFLDPFDKYSWEREYPVEKVVIHFTSNVVASRDNPYDMAAIRKIFEDYELSIHYIIDRDGKVYCYMPETRCAWHAGVGSYGEDERFTNAMNKYSIGIEIVAIGSEKDMKQYLTSAEYAALDKSLIGFTDAQYDVLAELVRDICTRNNISLDRQHVIGHDEYNPKKSDPGELFNWDRILN